jgi:hypothetical protein
MHIAHIIYDVKLITIKSSGRPPSKKKKRGKKLSPRNRKA